MKLSYSRKITACRVFGSILLLGVIYSLFNLITVTIFLINEQLLGHYLLLSLFSVILSTFMLTFTTALMVMFIIKSNKFFKLWLHGYGIYLILLFIYILVVNIGGLESDIYAFIGRLFFYVLWTVVMVLSDSFDNNTYGITKFSLKFKSFFRNMWS